MKTGLAALIHPHTTQDFMEFYEKNEPFLVHDPQYLTSLLELPFLNSLESLLNSWPFKIQVHLPDVRDEASSVEANNLDARKLFTNGMGLLFNEVHEISPVLQTFLADIRKDLGLSALTQGRCLVYATPDGKGTAPHFDQNINFVLQLQGTKTWNMAPNENVIHPLTRHTLGLRPDPELESYASSFPEAMPKNAQSYVLRPGSLLFVPKGYWHSTEASGDALALNFTYTAPTWIDLFSAALRSRLALSPEWRETADGVADPERALMAEKKFDYLLASFKEELSHWRAADILGATENE